MIGLALSAAPLAAAPASEKPVSADANDNARRAQQARLEDPEDWRRNMLASERDAQRNTETRFRSSSRGPAIEPPRADPGPLVRPTIATPEASRYRSGRPD